MDKLINELQISLKINNWYSALLLALTVPDICGQLENPTKNSKERYLEWFNKYLSKNYIKTVGAQENEHIFLSGADLYALRCSFLHENSGDISNQKAREVINNFIFSTTLSHLLFITNKSNGKKTLILRVDVFCEEICNALREWISDHKNNMSVQERIKSTIKIHTEDSLGIS